MKKFSLVVIGFLLSINPVFSDDSCFVVRGIEQYISNDTFDIGRTRLEPDTIYLYYENNCNEPIRITNFSANGGWISCRGYPTEIKSGEKGLIPIILRKHYLGITNGSDIIKTYANVTFSNNTSKIISISVHLYWTQRYVEYLKENPPGKFDKYMLDERIQIMKHTHSIVQ